VPIPAIGQNTQKTLSLQRASSMKEFLGKPSLEESGHPFDAPAEEFDGTGPTAEMTVEMSVVDVDHLSPKALYPSGFASGSAHPEPGDIVMLRGSAPARPAVVMHVAQAHCTVTILNDDRHKGVGECWLPFSALDLESCSWRLHARVVIVGLEGSRFGELNGISGTVISHPREGHPIFVRRGQPPTPRLSLCVRLDKPPIANQPSVLIQTRFLIPYKSVVHNLQAAHVNIEKQLLGKQDFRESTCPPSVAAVAEDSPSQLRRCASEPAGPQWGPHRQPKLGARARASSVESPEQLENMQCKSPSRQPANSSNDATEQTPSSGHESSTHTPWLDRCDTQGSCCSFGGFQQQQMNESSDKTIPDQASERQLEYGSPKFQVNQTAGREFSESEVPWNSPGEADSAAGGTAPRSSTVCLQVPLSAPFAAAQSSLARGATRTVMGPPHSDLWRERSTPSKQPACPADDEGREETEFSVREQTNMSTREETTTSSHALRTPVSAEAYTPVGHAPPNPVDAESPWTVWSPSVHCMESPLRLFTHRSHGDDASAVGPAQRKQTPTKSRSPDLLDEGAGFDLDSVTYQENQDSVTRPATLRQSVWSATARERTSSVERHKERASRDPFSGMWKWWAEFTECKCTEAQDTNSEFTYV